MNGKKTLKKTAATFLGLALAVGAVGCGNFIVTDSEKDLAQTVASVNISAELKKDTNYQDVADNVGAVLGSISTDISKRDLLASFLSTGYQYVESYGYSYKDTFNMLMDGLVGREILIQYAVAYYLKSGLTKEDCKKYVDTELAAAKARSAREEELLTAHPDVLTLKFFLTENGTVNEDYDLVLYKLKKSLNSSLDSLEEDYIQADSHEHNHEESRTLPTGVDTEKTDYYTQNYGVYTGRNTPDSCGEYERLDGSTTSTRKKAYNAFLANLQSYNMISSSGKAEDTSNVELLDYYYVELSSQLGQALVNKYFEALEEEISVKLEQDSYIQEKYDEIYEEQRRTYELSVSDYTTAMDGLSDTSFLLYGLKNYGYVYNILLPFSSLQSIEYSRAQNDAQNSQDDLYNIRKGILTKVEGKDQRGSWICAEEEDNYSSIKDGRYYFFQDQLQENSQYEKLKQYAGTYAYNGTVVEEDGELISKPASGVTIDKFIEIFEKHINDTVGSEVAAGALQAAYDTNNTNTVYTDATTRKVDYSKFTYYVGKTNITATAKDYFNADSDIYKAVSAVNELMFAYSTDTGCLNKYFGYSVSPYGTDFVKEFEYAAQYVVSQGAGSYAVCATDYGWHIVFASFVYSADGDVYGGYKAEDKDKEGTFSNIFYQSLKESAATNYSTEKQNEVLNRYNNENSVTLYTERYKDLLELDS